jgi:hypothetical protein
MNFFEFIILAILRTVGFVLRLAWGAVVFMCTIWATVLKNLASRD